MINEFQYENLANSYGQGKPFKHCIVDNFFEQSIALRLSEEFPNYHDDKVWAIYDNPIENKRLTPNWNLFPSLTYTIFSMLNSPEFVNKMRRITGISNLVADYGMHGGGWHVCANGGKLNIHKDYSIHPKLGMERRINLIIYMTPDWNQEWNGGLELWSHDEEKNLPKECVTRVENIFNRAIIFDTTDNSWHGLPKQIRCPENVYRKSLNIYYVAEARSNIETHDRAYFAPYEDQVNDPKILELIKKRSSSKTVTEVYRT